MQAQTAIQNRFINTIAHGDCIQVMRQMSANSVDFILADPPYLVNYKDRTGRSIQNDSNSDWLKPAMKEAYRVLKQDRLAAMFYGWNAVDKFFAAWREAGFYPVGHIVFRKDYASKSRLVRYCHEQAFLLAKGKPPLPKNPIADVIDVDYSGNKLHPTDSEASLGARSSDPQLLVAGRHSARSVCRQWKLLRSSGAHASQIHRNRTGRKVLQRSECKIEPGSSEDRAQAVL
jgi:hypothetical protein